MWVIMVFGQVFFDGLLKVLKDFCIFGEVQFGEVFMFKNNIIGDRLVYQNQVDDVIWQIGGFQYFYQQACGINLSFCRFLDDGVVKESRCIGQVVGNGGEVEWCNGKDKVFQWLVFYLVLDCGFGFVQWLVFVYFGYVLYVEVEEVGDFSYCFNFRLMGCFGLFQYCSCVYFVVVGAGDEVGSVQENGSVFLLGYSFLGWFSF